MYPPAGSASLKAPHLLRVCRGGDGAGAARHPVGLPLTVGLFIRAQRVHVSVAAEHEPQSLQRLRKEMHGDRKGQQNVLLLQFRSGLVQFGRIPVIVNDSFASSFVTQLTLSKALDEGNSCCRKPSSGHPHHRLTVLSSSGVRTSAASMTCRFYKFGSSFVTKRAAVLSTVGALSLSK